jgi:hypothetical protein
MKTRKQSSGGPRGLAQITVRKNEVLVEFDNQRDYPEAFEIARDNAPENIMTGHFNVRLSKQEDKIDGITVSDPGLYLVKVKNFIKRKDVPATPKFVDRKGPFTSKKNGGTFYLEAHREFYVSLTVQSGKFEGQEIFAGMWYMFEEDELTGLAYVSDNNNRQANLLNDFLAATGNGDIEIEFSDNILPDLEEAVMENDRAFQVKLNEKGYIEEISELPEGVLPTIAKKKPAKKSKK